jgi:hypothetical protein
MDLIDWTCDTCHRPTKGRGAIHIEYAEIHRVEAAAKEWRERAATGTATDWNPADALTVPEPGLWKVECDLCAGLCVGSYDIDLTQLRTAADVVTWTERLRDKSWYSATNWATRTAAVVEAQRARNTA